MKFLVTGANGFIGSYLCKYLLQQKHEVVALSRSFSPEIKQQLNGAVFIEADILNEEVITREVKADCIIHLAASNDIVSKSLMKGTELSVAGTVNMLKLANYNNIQKFIFYSTLQVYGTELSGNYTEQTPVKPENDYAMNHLFAEQYVEMYSRKFNLKTLVIRPSNIYGKFLSASTNRWTLVPGCFCKEAIEKGTITLLSSGKQLRNFISLEQLSYGTEQAAINMKERFDILNMVSDNYERIVDVAYLTEHILQKDFNRSASVEIKSEQPATSNAFSFDMAKQISYGIQAGHTSYVDLKTEIRSIIQLLSSAHAV
jgi:UDP-glucose 4-epimerase